MALDSLGRKNNRTSILGAVAGAALAATVASTEYGQRHVNDVNSARDHAFAIEELDLPTKIRYLIGTTAYGNHYTEALSKRIPGIASLLRNKVDVGLVHLYRGEMSSLEGAKQSIAEIRKNSKNQVLISADIEGGVVNHFKLTLADLRRFNVPEDILKERQAEYEFYLKKYKGNAKKVQNTADFPLPSQEWLGRQYKALKDAGARQKFLQSVQGYGKTIASISDYVGINMVFGPNIDTVENIDGTKPDEFNDRTYGEDPNIVRDLATAYIRGFQSVPTVLVVPKHFVGNSRSAVDPHEEGARVNIPPKSGAVLPYRDILNASNSESIKQARLATLSKRIVKLDERTLAYERQLARLKPKTQAYKQIQRSIAANKAATKHFKAERLRMESVATDDLPIGGIMTSVISTPLYGEKDTPIVYSKAIKERLKAPKGQGGLGHQGIAITDDLLMTSSTKYINEKVRAAGTKGLDTEALSVHQALAAGNELAFIKDVAGREDRIAKEVARYVNEKLSLRGNNRPDLTQQDVDNLLRRVLDIKVRVGLLTKQTIQGKEYYMLDPELYNPTTSDVLLNSAFSNQIPWTSKGQEPTTPQPNAISLLIKAAKNFTLSLWRVNLPTIEERYKEAEKNSKKLILIDKSAHHMWIYDDQTRILEREFDVGIGKGGIGERRFVGDHRTPTGVYELTQKRDDKWWRENKGQPLPNYYGGIEGGMLVLAGQWHPEIAIHGNDVPQLGEVSNGCVRVSNANIQELLKTIPIGTMVIVTK